MSFKWKIRSIVFLCGILKLSEADVCKGGDTNTCKCDFVNGSGVIDVSFGKTDNTPLYDKIADPGGYYIYAYNPCYPFATKDNTIKGLASLQYNDGSSQYYDIGQQTGATWKNDNGTIQLFYMSSDGSSTSTVTLVCNKNTATNSLTAQGLDASFVNYGFTLTGPSVCFAAGGGGLSGGSIFLFIFFVTFFIYLIGGIIFKKTREEASGTDLIPNKDFWSSLPGLIKDGFMFLVYKCKGGSVASYENI